MKGQPKDGPETEKQYRMPPPLCRGDRVAIFSPSSHSGKNPAEYLSQARELLTDWGLVPEPLEDPERRHLYLAGTDAERAETFQRLYMDPGIKALFAARGGYGAARMIPLLDGDKLAAAPPCWVVGMSDVTALFAYLGRLGTGTMHGPCLAAPAHNESPHKEENQEFLRQALFDPQMREEHTCGLLHRPPGTPDTLRGPLVGGCLSVLASGMGTPWELESRGAVMLLEDVDEAPYRIDRYITQLRQAGAFQGVAAVVFGHLKNCDGSPPGLLAQVLRDLFSGAPFPVLTGLQAGHGEINRALPLGREVELDLRNALPGELCSLCQT
ncbi:MAG: LD-carboxypeptidase [Deltaproteobacteria bacterium]|nr:LD-carboxypeptidase [Deltaproteobacteria bacterium]